MITKNEINKYTKDIKKQLLYGTKESKQFLKELKQNITDYVEENQNSDMAQVIEQFGKPEDIAVTFFEQYGKEDIKKKINIRRVIVVAVASALIVLAVLLVIELIDIYRENRGFFSENVFEIPATLSAYINSTDIQN